MESRALLLKQLKAYHQRSRERFERWRASGYRHDMKPHYEPMPEEIRHIPCGAKTRAGTPCKRTDISTNGRCKYHGGHSTGALTSEGKARQLEGYRRWQREKAENLQK
ncbi:HGGxSTG domain-containing protein [Chimaeribacter coloradensis]